MFLYDNELPLGNYIRVCLFDSWIDMVKLNYIVSVHSHNTIITVYLVYIYLTVVIYVCDFAVIDNNVWQLQGYASHIFAPGNPSASFCLFTRKPKILLSVQKTCFKLTCLTLSTILSFTRPRGPSFRILQKWQPDRLRSVI